MGVFVLGGGRRRCRSGLAARPARMLNRVGVDVNADGRPFPLRVREVEFEFEFLDAKPRPDAAPLSDKISP